MEMCGMIQIRKYQNIYQFSINLEYISVLCKGVQFKCIMKYLHPDELVNEEFRPEKAFACLFVTFYIHKCKLLALKNKI